MFPTASVVALALLLVSCGGKADEKAGGGGGDGSAATDDSAASSDGTAEDPRTLDTGGSDSDSGDSPADICENPASVTPVDECVDHVLTCNRTMLHTTRAGARRFSGEDYAAWGCGEDLPTDRYRARERIYSLTHPGDGVPIELRLTSPCGELDLIVVPWADWEPGGTPEDGSTGECPTADSEFGADECVWRSTMGSESMRVNADEETRYLVIVDGREAAGMNYQIRASCGGGTGGGGGPGSGDGSGGGGGDGSGGGGGGESLPSGGGDT